MLSQQGVTIDGVEERLLIYSMKIQQTPFQHDSMTLVLRNQHLSTADLHDGTLVSAYITTGVDTIEFRGYINHLAGATDRQVSSTEIVCLGATSALKARSQDVWFNMTASSIAKEICARNKMSYDIYPHTRIFEFMPQAGRTDWEMLCYLAKRSGYSLWSSGTTIHMGPRTKLWEDRKDLAPVYTLHKSTSPAVGNLTKFFPHVGDGLLSDGILPSKVLVSGIDSQNLSQFSVPASKGKKTIRKTAPGRPYTYYPETAVSSSLDAQAEADAAYERSSYPIKADLVGWGDAIVQPNFPVYVRGVQDDYEGYWLTDSVVHEVFNGRYSITAALVSDSKGLSDKALPSHYLSLQSLSIKSGESFLLDQGNIVLPGERTTNTSAPKWRDAMGNLR